MTRDECLLALQSAAEQQLEAARTAKRLRRIEWEVSDQTIDASIECMEALLAGNHQSPAGDRAKRLEREGFTLLAEAMEAINIYNACQRRTLAAIYAYNACVGEAQG